MPVYDKHPHRSRALPKGLITPRMRSLPGFRGEIRSHQESDSRPRDDAANEDKESFRKKAEAHAYPQQDTTGESHESWIYFFIGVTHEVYRVQVIGNQSLA